MKKQRSKKKGRKLAKRTVHETDHEKTHISDEPVTPPNTNSAPPKKDALVEVRGLCVDFHSSNRITHAVKGISNAR